MAVKVAAEVNKETTMPNAPTGPTEDVMGKLYRYWILVLWLFGFAPFPDQFGYGMPRLSVAGNFYGALQASAVIAVQAYSTYDKTLQLRATNFNTIVVYLCDIFDCFVIVFTVWTGWMAGKKVLQFIEGIKQPLARHFTQKDQRKLFCALGLWAAVHGTITLYNIFHVDIPSYLESSERTCQIEACYMLLMLYHAAKRMNIVGERIVETLILFTAVLLSEMVRLIRVKATVSLGSRKDGALFLKEYTDLRRCAKLFDREFSWFNLAYAFQYLIWTVTAAYRLGNTYATEQSLSWPNLLNVVRGAGMLTAIAVAFVRLQENLTGMVSVLHKLAAQHGSQRAEIDQLLEKVKMGSCSFSIGGLLITRDFCLGIAGTIFTNIIMFSELGHGGKTPRTGWFVQSLRTMLSNETVVIVRNISEQSSTVTDRSEPVNRPYVTLTGFLFYTLFLYVTFLLWFMGFGPFPNQVCSQQHSVSRIANGYGIVQGLLMIASQIYGIYDYTLMLKATSFNALVVYLLDVIGLFATIYAVWIGWTVGRNLPHQIGRFLGKFGDWSAGKEWRKLTLLFASWASMQMSISLYKGLSGDIAMYSYSSTKNCRTAVCYGLIASYFVWWRAGTIGRGILDSLVLLTVAILSVMARKLVSKTAASVNCLSDSVGYITLYVEIRHWVKILESQLELYNLTYVFQYLMRMITAAYLLGDKYSKDQKFDGYQSATIFRSSVMLAGMVVAYVSLYENMAAMYPVLWSLESKYGSEFEDDKYLIDEIKTVPCGIRVGGMLLTRDSCLAVAGIIFIHIILFLELGHGSNVPDTQWFSEALRLAAANGSMQW